MEDTKSLLIMVLHKIFHNRLDIVEDTYQLIYDYNNGKKGKNDYERTLKNICDLMNDELPSEILVYLLTLVDIPHEDGSQLPIMEKIQKTHCCLAESVRPSLVEYLAKKKEEEKISHEKDASSKQNIKIYISSNAVTEMFDYKECNTTSEQLDNKFLKPIFKGFTCNKRKIGNNQDSLKSLLEITANYVIENEKELKYMYKLKLTQAWKLINLNFYSGEILKQCYNTLENINKNIKLLRCIENDNILDVLIDEYENSNIFLKERNLFHMTETNHFQLKKNLVGKLKYIIKD